MLNIIAILVGLFGVAVAIYFGLASRKQRELVFSVNPIRTRVVSSRQATELSVSYQNEPLGNVDITAVQLAIWNAGNESIKAEHIRKEIIVTTNPPVRILEASVRKVSPDTGFNLSDSTDSKAEGRVPLSWEILERNDGASIQLLYLDNPVDTSEVDILIEGLIEGQGRTKRKVTSSSFKSPQEHWKSLRQQSFFVAISFLVLLVTGVLRFAFQVRGPEDAVLLLFDISVFLLFVAVLSLLSTMRERFPPFGF